MTDFENKKVVIRTTDGMYLSTSSEGLRFSNDLYGAVVFDYEKDQVEQKLSLLRQVHGLALEAVSLKPEEVFETCDQCRRMVIPAMAFFDGKRFVCGACKRKGA